MNAARRSRRAALYVRVSTDRQTVGASSRSACVLFVSVVRLLVRAGPWGRFCRGLWDPKGALVPWGV